MQIKQGELQLKQGELKLKEKQFQVDSAAKADEQQLKETTLNSKMELDGLRVGAQIKQADAKLQSDQERAGVQMGIDIARTRHEAAQKAQQPKGPAA